MSLASPAEKVQEYLSLKTEEGEYVEYNSFNLSGRKQRLHRETTIIILGQIPAALNTNKLCSLSRKTNRMSSKNWISWKFAFRFGSGVKLSKQMTDLIKCS